jgi:hypothetical protein
MDAGGRVTPGAVTEGRVRGLFAVIFAKLSKLATMKIRCERPNFHGTRMESGIGGSMAALPCATALNVLTQQFHHLAGSAHNKPRVAIAGNTVK